MNSEKDNGINKIILDVLRQSGMEGLQGGLLRMLGSIEGLPQRILGNYETRLEGGLLYLLYTNKAIYKAREPVRMLLAKVNVTPTSMQLTYKTGQRYDFIVTYNDREIWKWSREKFFTLAIEQVTLDPGQNETAREVWNQVDNEGRPVPPGSYRLEGVNTATGVSLSVRIKIQ